MRFLLCLAFGLYAALTGCTTHYQATRSCGCRAPFPGTDFPGRLEPAPDNQFPNDSPETSPRPPASISQEDMPPDVRLLPYPPGQTGQVHANYPKPIRTPEPPIGYVPLPPTLQCIPHNELGFDYVLYRKSGCECEEWESSIFGRSCVREDCRTYIFSENQKRIVAHAVAILSCRLLDEPLLSDVLANSSVAYFPFPVFDLKHQFRFRASDDSWKSFSKLVQRQFSGLRSRGVPRIHIHPYRDSPDTGGEASERLAVRVQEVGQSLYEVSGQFHIYLNLSGNGLRDISMTDPRYVTMVESTAGTIAHEMLHQMGHSHPRGYNDNNFITAFGDSIEHQRYHRRTSQLNRIRSANEFTSQAISHRVDSPTLVRWRAIVTTSGDASK